MKVIADLGLLMRLAREVNIAKADGCPEKIKIAQNEHNSYKEICLKADETATGLTVAEMEKK